MKGILHYLLLGSGSIMLMMVIGLIGLGVALWHVFISNDPPQ